MRIAHCALAQNIYSFEGCFVRVHDVMRVRVYVCVPVCLLPHLADKNVLLIKFGVKNLCSICLKN